MKTKPIIAAIFLGAISVSAQDNIGLFSNGGLRTGGLRTKEDDLTTNHLGTGIAVFSDGVAHHNCKAISCDGKSVHFASNEGEFDMEWKTIPSDVQKRILPDVQKLVAAWKAAHTATADDQPVVVEAKITQIVSSGALVSAQYHKMEDRTFHTGYWDKIRHVWVGDTVKPVDVLQPLGDVFIAGDFSKFADGETWSGTVWPAGVSHFTTVLGAERSVRRWAMSRELAQKLLSER